MTTLDYKDNFVIDKNQSFKHEMIRYVNHLKKQIVFEQQMNRYKNLVIAALFAGIEERDKQLEEANTNHDVVLGNNPYVLS